MGAYGVVHAKGNTKPDCPEDDEWCYTNICVTIIKDNCKLDQGIEFSFDLVGGLTPYKYTQKHRIISDTCPVKLGGIVKPDGKIDLYDANIGKPEAKLVGGYYEDQKLCGRVQVNGHGHDIVASQVKITKVSILQNNGDTLVIHETGTNYGKNMSNHGNYTEKPEDCNDNEGDEDEGEGEEQEQEAPPRRSLAEPTGTCSSLFAAKIAYCSKII